MSSVWCCLMLRSSFSRRVATGLLGVDGACAGPNCRKASESSVVVPSGAYVWGSTGRPHASRMISSVRPPSPPPTTQSSVMERQSASVYIVMKISNLRRNAAVASGPFKKSFKLGSASTSLSPPGNLRSNSGRHKNCTFSSVTKDRR